MHNKYSKALFFVSSALLASLAMDYPHTLWFFLFIFLIPVLYYVDTQSLTFSKKKDLTTAFCYMFLFGFVFTICSTYWFLATYPLDWMGIYSSTLSIVIIGGIWSCFGIAMGLPIAMWIYIAHVFKKLPPLTSALTGASGWVVLEYVRSWLVAIAIYSPEALFGPHHTYYSLAYPISSAPELKELVPVGGMYLTSFAVILINYFIYHTIRTYLSKDRSSVRSLTSLGVLISCIIVVCASGMYAIRQTNLTSTTFLTSIITTNLPSGTKPEVRKEVSFAAANSVPDENAVIILPENINVLTPPQEKELQENTLSHNKHLIIGSFSGEKFATMYFLNPQDGNVKLFGKRLLMPVGEYNISWVRFLLEKIQGPEWVKNYEKLLHISNKKNDTFIYQDTLNTDVRIAGTLCSENISPYIYRDSTKLGATVFVNLASHAPFRGSPLLLRQTMAISATRALENGRYYVTSSNATKSFVITDQGNIQNLSDSKEVYSHFDTYIPTKDYTTPYVLYGDYFVIVSFAVLVLAFLWL